MGVSRRRVPRGGAYQEAERTTNVLGSPRDWALADGGSGPVQCQSIGETQQMRIAGGTLRNGILNLALKDVNEIYASFMPFVENGGLFIRTSKGYSLGDQVFVLLDLVDEPEKIPLTGEVVWINPIGSGSRPQGIGIRLGGEYGEVVTKLENHLAGLANIDRFSHTI